MQPDKQPPAIKLPEHYYGDGLSTYDCLADRFGNNLITLRDLSESRAITLEQAERNKMTFIRTLEEAIRRNAPEDKGVTLHNLADLVGVIRGQDWTKKEDLDEAELAINTLLRRNENRTIDSEEAKRKIEALLNKGKDKEKEKFYHNQESHGHKYCKGESTYQCLCDRYGNNLNGLASSVEGKTMTPAQANHERLVFINTLIQAVEQKAIEEKGITREKLKTLVEVIRQQDWSNIEDIKKAEEIILGLLGPALL